MKKIWYSVILFILLFMLSGCKGSKEEHDGVFDESISGTVTSQIFKPSNEAICISQNASSDTESSLEDESSIVASSNPEVPKNAKVMYLARYKYAKQAPYPDAKRSRFYTLWEQVFVVGKTDTGYYELNNGDYIACEYLVYGGEAAASAELKYTDFSQPSDAPIRKKGIYSVEDALSYAARHWQEDTSLCAEFVSECLTAGGFKYDIASATELYNKLMEDKAGSAFEISLDCDGTAVVPDYVKKGDVVFYYCSNEELMVHCALVNEITEDRHIKAYAHNPCDGAVNELSYKKYCPGDCGYLLDKLVIVCMNGK